MKNPYKEESDTDDKLEKILGFGERSMHKSYYPELQKTIIDLKFAEGKYHNIFQNALNGIFQFDLFGKLLEANPAFIAIMGFSSREEARSAINNTGHVLFHDPEEWKDIYVTLQKDQKVEKRIARIVKKDGNLIWGSINAITVLDTMGRPLYVEGFIEDVTSQVEYADALKKMAAELERKVSEKTRELEEANQKLLILSNTDGLTGIANRRHFNEMLNEEWRRAARFGQLIAVVMLDIDLFKNYNDHYGHLAGDECLRQVAGVLKANARRSGDFCARYGGEEFVLILPGFTGEQAEGLAELIRGALENLAIAHEKSPYGLVTVSIGVAAGIPDKKYATPEQLLKTADDAMYLAKSRGRNLVVYQD